jgi:hypothetical protein
MFSLSNVNNCLRGYKSSCSISFSFNSSRIAWYLSFHLYYTVGYSKVICDTIYTSRFLQHHLFLFKITRFFVCRSIQTNVNHLITKKIINLVTNYSLMFTNKCSF